MTARVALLLLRGSGSTENIWERSFSAGLGDTLGSVNGGQLEKQTGRGLIWNAGGAERERRWQTDAPRLPLSSHVKSLL